MVRVRVRVRVRVSRYVAAGRGAYLQCEAGVVLRLGPYPRLGFIRQRHAHTDNAPRGRGRFRGRVRVRVGVRGRVRG